MSWILLFFKVRNLLLWLFVLYIFLHIYGFLCKKLYISHAFTLVIFVIVTVSAAQPALNVCQTSEEFVD